MTSIPIGRRLDGPMLELPTDDGLPHILIGGKTGGGKSVLMSAIGAGLAADPNFALVGIDLKLMELAFWRPGLTALANTADDASLLLANTVAEIDRRNELLMSLGLRSWETRLGRRIVVFIDELARLAGVAVERLLEQARLAGKDDDGDGPSRADARMFRAAKEALAVRLAMIEHIAAVGRAAGVTLVCATQYPTADVIDPQIRSQLSLRFMLRVVSKEQVRVILGDGNQQLISPDSIPESEPGGFWCVGMPGNSRPIRGRSLLLTDATLKQRFRDTSHLRATQTEVFQAFARQAA